MDANVAPGRALELFHTGEPQQAIAAAQELLTASSLDTDQAAEMNHLIGACFHQLGQTDEALKYLLLASRLNPLNPTYYNTYGVVLRKSGRLESAIRSYEFAIKYEPNFADCFYNRGNALAELKRKDEASLEFQQCLRLNPTHNNAHHNLANIYRDQNHIDLALDHYRISNECQPHNPDMHCNWGLALQLKEQWGDAIDQFEIAINQKSDHAPSYVNLGSALSVQERFDEACSALRKGVEIDDSCHDAKFNLGLTLLTIGQMDEGWKFYETRLHLPDKVITPFPGIPVWDGSVNLDSPLMVWAEQGYGDNIQFVRYIPILMEMGLDVVLSTRKPLMSLFRECLSPSAPPIVEHRRQDLNGFQHHIPLLSLPRVLGTRLDTVPLMPGYLKRPERIPDHLQISRPPFALNIGLVWASGVDNKEMYADKSLPLQLLLPLFDRWRKERLVCIHSLQVGQDASQLLPWKDEWGVFDWNDKLSSFLDTACVISQLDLVVSVDTAVAHVAGALDKPVWVLLQHNADFRWMRGRTDSPWYSSMSLFRQKSLGDWSSALESLQERLIHLLGP